MGIAASSEDAVLGRKGKPVVRRGRKATGPKRSAGLPNLEERVISSLVNARVRIILIPLLVGLIGAEVALGAVGAAAVGGKSHQSRSPRLAALQRVSVAPRLAAITRIELARRPPEQRPVAPAPRVHVHNVATVAKTPTVVSTGWGCGDALAWLSSHAAPGYQFECPGYAEGHQAMTCINAAACPGIKLIVIADPCPAAYMNEAHNSWVMSGLLAGTIDPYGHCN